MITHFKNLSDEVRTGAVKELITDYEAKNLYVSKKLASGKYRTYFKGLVQALFCGNDSSFAQYLITQNCLTAEALKRSNAAEALAYNEFKRYYIRGVCLQAIKEGKILCIYRAKESKNKSEDAEDYAGNTLHPTAMLAIAQLNPELRKDQKRAEYRVLRPNSSLCVEIYDAGKTIDNGGKTNG